MLKLGEKTGKWENNEWVLPGRVTYTPCYHSKCVFCYIDIMQKR